MKLPNQFTSRSPIDPKLAVGSSLPNPKGLFGIVLALYLINEEKDYLDFSIKKNEGIILKFSLITSLKSFFKDVNGYSEDEVESLESKNPLLDMQIEPLQVALQLFWKIAKINILGTDSSSKERTGRVRYPKELFFTTNMDLIKGTISNEDDIVSNKGKELIYCWLFNKTISPALKQLEDKLIKTLTIFTEETLFKTWENSNEIIFQQEGIYSALDSEVNKVNLKGSKEIKGTLRNLKSAIGKNIHSFLKIDVDDVQLKDSNLSEIFKSYQNKVSNYLDLNPQLIEIKTIDKDIDEEHEVDSSLNKIYFGAPGTGKSYTVNELLKGKEDWTEKITFHPEYDYASFVGGYKPITEKNEDSGKDEIKYKFVPQVFTNMYVEAWNNRNNEYYLVIEEINRGNCAEIFGDIFQLLDRDPDYDITPSDELKKHLVEELVSEEGIKSIENGKMRLPSNLNIIATMNTSDQSLFPMDSAFKRRWDWQYIPINYERSVDNPSSKFQVEIPDVGAFSWIEFIEKVNTIIKDNQNLGMDKCIGNYFIKGKDNVISFEDFINKGIFYLWNDVFKDEDDHIFDENTYEDFFPIHTKGKNQVLKVLDKLDIKYLNKEG